MKKFTPLWMLLLTVFVLHAASDVTDYISMNTNVSDRDRNIVDIKKEKENSLDVLVAGDSESYTAVSPMVLYEKEGIASFDCGQSGQHMVESYYRLKEALKRQKPKLFILETNLFFRDYGIMDNMRTAMMEFGSQYFSIFRYHDLWKRGMIKKEQGIGYKGFMIRNSVGPVSDDMTAQYMKETQHVSDIPSETDHYFRKIKALCDRNNVKVLLLSIPSPKNFSYGMYNALNEYAHKLGVAYLDLNTRRDDLGIDWKKDSLDQGDHLNIFGAEKVSVYLSAYLKEHYDLEDRRDDPDYESWSVLLEQYNAERKAL